MDEPALADAGRAEDRDEDAAFLDDGSLEGGTQDPEFAIATDHRTPDATVDGLGRLVHGDETPDRDRLVATLDLDLARLAGHHRVADQPPGRVADERLARFGGLLQAGGDIDRVTGRAAAAGSRVADDDRAGVDADAHPDLEAAFGPEGAVQGRQRDLHVGGGAHGPERVVLVDDRDAEDGHDRVADELLDRSAVALEDRAHRVEPAAHDRAERLRVEVLAEPGRAGDVGEHDGDDLARLARRFGRGERGTAGHAEAGDVGVLRRAGRAGDHPVSLGRAVCSLYRLRMHHAEAQAEAGAPSGALAFLFTDIEGSTRLWERLPEAMTVALARHDAILRTAIEASAGRVVKTTGDGMMAVFPTAADGVLASIAAQRSLAAEAWTETGPLRVRMALHAGEAERRGDDFFGPTINRTARIMSAGHGGQVLLSSAAAALAAGRLPHGASLRDLGEYRLKDLGRPERVFQLVHPDLQATFPPLTTLDQGAAGLPIRAAPFVGRRAELAEVDRRLEDPAIRLLTLTGPGGTGKTSLGIRAASDQASRFRDGVAFVDLSAARDTDAVLIALGRALGVGETLDRPLRDELIERLRGSQMLLVLDNFEQVTAAAGVTTELLDGCSEIKLLVTSREPLHVRAEHVYPVPPLGLPPAGRAKVTAAQLELYESVELFVDRARAVRPDFELDDDNAAAIAEICRRLDGLPLAIELAAARLRLFSPEALLDRLGRRLELLRSATRELPERQQTLRATIEWSYQLLEPGEQHLFDVLAVFVGADLPAVEAVVTAIDDDAGPGTDTIDTLASLLEKSLIRQVDVVHGEPRLVMLETIREYATDRLVEHDLGPKARLAHATYYADLAGRLRGELAGPKRDQAMAAMVDRGREPAGSLALLGRGIG